MTSAHIIDGKYLAYQITADLQQEILQLKSKTRPGLATVLVGDDPASHVYVANKRKTAEAIGIKSFHYQLDIHCSQKELLTLIHELNINHQVNGILVQLPLPAHLDEKITLDAIDALKDVDGFHPINLGYLFRGSPTTVACTPLGVMDIIRSVGYQLKGKHAVVIGRSTIVGKPMAILLLDADATVTICHSHTTNLSEITRQADLVIAAAGKPKFIKKTHLKKGAFVVDVGINRDEHNKLCGDVDFADVVDHVSYITPVPGGVGPMTIAMLLKNTMSNFKRSHHDG